MKRISENGAGSGTKAVWSLVVVYEDAAARARAVSFCDQLMRRFWARFEFDLDWCSFASIERARPAQAAADKVARADLVVFSAAPEGDLPLPVTVWLDRCLKQRGEREGMFIGLLGSEQSPQNAEGPKHRFLRNAAHRGSMDYLTQVPQDLSRDIPDSLDSYTSRADQVTSLLDNILRRQPPPPGPLP